MAVQTAAVSVFRTLHRTGCFVMPNPWDCGSARLLEGMGFPALATTSAGLAWSLGRPDNAVPIDIVLDHLARLSAAVDVPLNADFEGGFAIQPDDVAANVTRAVATGIAGLSIEDATGDSMEPLFEMELAVERIRAARQAIDASGAGVLMTGRCESFLVGRPDLAVTIRRLVAYAEAGAECLYAPGLREPSDIGEVVRAVAPHPVNVLAGGNGPAVSELAALGVRRISVGGALARSAWTAMIATARELAERGTFGGFSAIVPSAELNERFRASGGPRRGQ